MKDLRQLWKVLVAIYREEPYGHVKDLWDEFTGKVKLCGNPPYQYLIEKCTRPAPHKCKVNGPCNGFPK